MQVLYCDQKMSVAGYYNIAYWVLRFAADFATEFVEMTLNSM